MSIAECASHLRDIFNNAIPAFETDPDAINYLISVLKEYKAITQAIDGMKQILVSRISATEHEQHILEAELEQMDLSYRETVSPKVFQAIQSLSTIASKVGTAASSNNIPLDRPYGSEIIAQLAVIEMEVFSLETQLAEIAEKQKQKQSILCDLQQQRRKLDELNDGQHMERVLLHEQRQIASLTEIEQASIDLEHSIVTLNNNLQHRGVEMGDFNIDSLAKGVLEVAASQQRVMEVLDTPEYKFIARVPLISPKEMDIEIDRIRAELNEVIAQLDDV